MSMISMSRLLWTFFSASSKLQLSRPLYDILCLPPQDYESLLQICRKSQPDYLVVCLADKTIVFSEHEVSKVVVMVTR
jgi:hypothetical protein